MNNGRIVHVNIPAVDLVRSQAFYEKVFGWVFTPNVEGYLLFSDRGGIGGGLTTGAHPTPDGVLIFISVSDIPGALEEIEQAGGTTELGRSPVGGPGFYAIFRDPAGNRVGLFCDH